MDKVGFVLMGMGIGLGIGTAIFKPVLDAALKGWKDTLDKWEASIKHDAADWWKDN